MLRKLLAKFGCRIEYVSEYGVHEFRYDSIDAQCGRPIHPSMSVAPPWAKRRIVRAAPSAGNGGAEERKPIGYMNERAVSILAQGSVMCTHVSPTKTEFQQIAIYKDPV